MNIAMVVMVELVAESCTDEHLLALSIEAWKM
jgi:hypothetical protein